MEKLLVLEIQDAALALEATTSRGDQGRSSSGVNSSSSTKQQVHNAKERLRRLNLKASYTALRYLLPNSKRSKKRWSAAKILEKALKYIPELLAELRRLTLAKERRALISNETNKRNKSHAYSYNNTSISITEGTNGGELYLQICAKRATSSHLLSSLMFKVEENGMMSIKGVSSVDISDDITCCHLHIQMNDANQGPAGIDYIAILRDELASWLN